MEQQPEIEQPQPDFTSIAENFGALAEQFARCRNLPAVDQGQNLLQAMAALNNNVMEALNNFNEAIRADLRTEIRAINVRLETKLVALSFLSLPLLHANSAFSSSEANSAARVMNASVTEPDFPLEPLRAVATGEEIPNFPGTVSDITAMPGR